MPAVWKAAAGAENEKIQGLQGNRLRLVGFYYNGMNTYNTPCCQLFYGGMHYRYRRME
ncbi:MAG: hypothetical protein LUD18_00200 [Lachnospiraceae bacterium]|nr:hypothetical protein [Lachnospiraceae bacterium]